MKRIISLCAVLCMTCACLVGTAFAVGHTYPSFPDGFERLYVFSYGNNAFLYAVPFGSTNDAYIDGDGDLLFNPDFLEGVCRYRLNADKSEWVFVEELDPDNYYFGAPEVLSYATHNVYFEDGNLYYPADKSVVSDVPVLSGVTTAELMQGVLGEVLGMVAIVIPVVIGFFGICKAIAWLFSRIRSV